MPAPFDLDTAVAHCRGPARLWAFLISTAVRDGADRLVLGPDPTPNVIGVEVSHTVSGKRYLLVPPPIAFLPQLIDFLRALAGANGECPLRLCGQEFVGRVRVESGSRGERATVDLPLMPALSAQIAESLAPYLDRNGCIEFENADFA